MTTILVTGDLCVEHHIYRGDRRHPQAVNHLGSSVASSIGGAVFLHDLLKSGFRQMAGSEVVVSSSLKKVKLNDIPSPHHHYSILKSKKNINDESIWAVDEIIGYGVGTKPVAPTLNLGEKNRLVPDILVIEDRGLGFRSLTKKWPACLNVTDPDENETKPRWVVLRMAHPVMQSDLFMSLKDRWAERLVVVVSAEDLRQAELLVSRGYSWEKTVTDLYHEIRTNPILRTVSQCAHFIISFDSEGAFIINNNTDGQGKASLVFDPGCLEGQWKGSVSKSESCSEACITAGIVGNLAIKDGAPVETGVKHGLMMRRELLRRGHGPVSARTDSERGLPLKQVAGYMCNGDAEQLFSCIPIDMENKKNVQNWSILGDQAGESTQPLYGIARSVALYGTGRVSSMPYGQFGKLLTVDRNELESLNGIRRLVENYVHKGSGKKPLSIGVFGPPGAGKSFGIKEIVRGIIEDCEILEYNLSQFEVGGKSLTGLLHSVRDTVLKGRLPIVFWDEFDSRQLAWLQYLLAPMQDGHFLEDGQVHPLGKCVFVFAGGTASTMGSFTPADRTSENYREFKLKKGPDFVSRLHGYLNVLGPNQRLDDLGNPDPGDIFFPIRRAILLRVMSGVFGNRLLNIDTGLLSAFLQTGEYKHGARSMEAVVSQTIMAGHQGLFRSNLPPREQIEIHVDYDQFCGIIRSYSDFMYHCDTLAPAIHKHYSTTYGDETYGSVPFEKLPSDIKASNIAAALRISEIFALAGLSLVPASSSGTLTAKEIRARLSNSIERLAEAEHNGWMEQKVLGGWHFGEKDDERKTHPCLIAYKKLSENDKKKDRDAVMNYSRIIEEAGFAAVPTGGMLEREN